MQQPSLPPATESSYPTTLYGVPWWQSGQSLQQAQWGTPAQARQCRDQAAATSREQNFLVAGTLVSGPFRAAVGVLKEHASLVAEQFRTPPPVAQACLLVKGECDCPFWPDSADLGVAVGRRLSSVHRS